MSNVPSNLIPTRLSQLPIAPVASADGYLPFVYQGATYKVRAGDLLQVSGVPTTRQVIAGTGMQGGGQLTSDVTLSIAPGGVGSSEISATGVTAGVYGSPLTSTLLTIDSGGRVASASDVQSTPDVGVAVGILSVEHGGTGKNITPVSGGIVYSDASGLQVSPAGVAGQVPVSQGPGSPLTWGVALIITDQSANTFYAGPASGGAGPVSFRGLTPADLPGDYIPYTGATANVDLGSNSLTTTGNLTGVLTALSGGSF